MSSSMIMFGLLGCALFSATSAITLGEDHCEKAKDCATIEYCKLDSSSGKCTFVPYSDAKFLNLLKTMSTAKETDCSGDAKKMVFDSIVYYAKEVNFHSLKDIMDGNAMEHRVYGKTNKVETLEHAQLSLEEAVRAKAIAVLDMCSPLDKHFTEKEFEAAITTTIGQDRCDNAPICANVQYCKEDSQSGKCTFVPYPDLKFLNLLKTMSTAKETDCSGDAKKLVFDSIVYYAKEANFHSLKDIMNANAMEHKSNSINGKVETLEHAQLSLELNVHSNAIRVFGMCFPLDKHFTEKGFQLAIKSDGSSGTKSFVLEAATAAVIAAGVIFA